MSVVPPHDPSAAPERGAPAGRIAGAAVIQNAYVVNDIDEAIERWHRVWRT
ncbi:MAG: hypothetical protein RLZ83_1, partial [Pseudomonadota bacterium]